MPTNPLKMSRSKQKVLQCLRGAEARLSETDIARITGLKIERLRLDLYWMETGAWIARCPEMALSGSPSPNEGPRYLLTPVGRLVLDDAVAQERRSLLRFLPNPFRRAA